MLFRKQMSDIFISYRRKEAESFSYLLYKDLVKDGYSVFYDHKTLGAGDFKKAIYDNIAKCNDVILIVTESSFGEKILDENDIYRYEIETALRLNKRIVGIMLEGFETFPEKLPEEIDHIRYINCLKMHMEYYDAMYSRLTSGEFLISVIDNNDDALINDIAIDNSIPKELQSFSKLNSAQRNNCIELLLKLMDSFNNSEICMRFYNYIDMIDRNKGINDIPTYKGILPTDLVTYLSFFETLYVVIASGAVSLDVINHMYKFRFFAGCNNLLMQESELLPLGYQYPNIISLYNMWSNHIVDKYDHNVKCSNISEEIPGYEHDLHKRYAAYCFSNRINVPVMIRFLNRFLYWKQLTLKLMDPGDFEKGMQLQEEVVNGISNNASKNIFEALTPDEMYRSLKNNIGIGLYDEDELVAQINLLVNIPDHENLVLDLLPEVDLSRNPAVIDYVVVKEDYRGFEIQSTLLFAAECVAKKYGKEGIAAVISPFNVNSMRNFLSQGYKVVATLPKYHSERHYVWKEIH